MKIIAKNRKHSIIFLDIDDVKDPLFGAGQALRSEFSELIHFPKGTTETL